MPGLSHSASPVQPAKILNADAHRFIPIIILPDAAGGYSFYFGFVPYRKGDYEIQALQRAFPEANYPPSMRAWTPRSGF